MTDEFDVAVVGLGPVGATAAALLAKRGLRVLAIEPLTEPYPMPRAGSIDHEVYRVFNDLGLANKIEKSLTTVPSYTFVNGNGDILIQAEYGQGPYEFGAPPFMFFWQPEVEAALRELLASEPTASLRFGHRVSGLSQDETGVTLTVTDDDGNSQECRSKYVIAADGGASTVRRALGIPLEDFDCNESWLAVDAEATRPLDLPHALQICDPRRPTGVFKMPRDFCRWLFMVLPGEDPTELAEKYEELTAPWAKPEDINVVRRVVYTFHGLNAESWSKGRVFLAGDAAHQAPPNLGQGLCSGIRDVANLAWKFDAVIRGVAGAQLLDSYEVERRPHMATIIGKSVELGRILCTVDPVEAAERDAHLIAERAKGGGNIERDRVLPNLEAGVIETTSSGAGELFIQPDVAMDGSTHLLDAALGQSFALVVRGDATLEMSEPSSLAWARLGSTVRFYSAETLHDGPSDGPRVVDSYGFLDRWFDRNCCDFALIRPDRYVYATGALAELSATIQHLSRDLVLNPTSNGSLSEAPLIEIGRVK